MCVLYAFNNNNINYGVKLIRSCNNEKLFTLQVPCQTIIKITWMFIIINNNLFNNYILVT